MIRFRHLLLLSLLLAPSVVFADDEPFHEMLAEAVEALQTGEYEHGLELLDRAEAVRTDPRVVYYRGYALEKLGRCREAEGAYERATRQKFSDARMQKAAADALAGIDDRCEPAPTPKTAESPAAAESADQFAAAVEALRREDFEEGLRLLDEADARIVYYRGYALEKLGRCTAAKKAYRQATRQEYDDPRLQKAAQGALEGVDERCASVELAEEDEARSEPKRQRLGTGRLGWKIFGWSASALGVVTLLTIPVKTAAEQTAAREGEQYFELRYGCEVELGAVSGESCDFEGMREDDVYVEYLDALDKARTTTTLLIITGAGLATAGVITLAVVATTPGSAKKAAFDVTPIIGRGVAGLSLSCVFQ